MTRSFRFSAVSAFALVLFSATLIAPVGAQEAKRQIVVNPKAKTFTVNDSQVAEVERAKRPDRVKTKRFRVEEDNGGNGGIEQADTEAPVNPRPPKTQEFRVDEENAGNGGFDQAETAPPKRRPVDEFRVDDEQDQAADAPVVLEGEGDVALKPEFETPAPKAKKPKAPVMPEVTEPDVAEAFISSPRCTT
jgi:hypothetical protein